MKETGIHRIRLSSLEINEIDDELIELMQDPRICNHLHIPLQSGSNKILGLMKRNYKAEFYMNKIEKIASGIENLGLGTDIIVGFPGEGEKEFFSTYELVNKLPFTYLHIFPFSPRPGTEAYSMNNRPSKTEVKGRIDMMFNLDKRKKYKFMSEQINRRLEVIIEDRIDKGTVSGKSSNYLKISVMSDVYNKGSIVIIRPVRIRDEILEGIVIN